MTAVYYQVRPNGGTDESLWLTVPAAALPQVVVGLAAGSFQVRALGASAWSIAVTVTASSAPAQFGYLQWDMDPNGDIIVSSLPDDNGAAITALEYRIGTGSAVALSGATAGTYSSAAVPGNAVQVRAVNSSGAGTWSIAQLCPVFVDRFNRANEALEVSANWDQETAGVLGVVSNGLQVNTDGLSRQGWVTAAAANLTNCRIELDIVNFVRTGAGGTTVNLMGRHPVGGNASGDAALMQMTSIGNALFQTRTGTTSTTIRTISWAPPASGTFRAAMELDGNAMRFFINGVLVDSETQTAFTGTGRPGVRAFRSAGTAADAVRVDNFRVSPL
jgi:hypothetical protein